MPTPTEGQWQLTYPGCVFTFGTIGTGRYFLTAPSANAGDIRDGDTAFPHEDGVRFGRDYRGAPSWTFEVGVDTVDVAGRHAPNLEALGAFQRAWDAEVIRDDPGAVAALTTTQAGRTRTVFGRPRRWAESGGQFTREGYTPVVCDFACVDSRWYGDEQAENVTLVPPATSGGLIAPLRAPLVAVGASERAGLFTIGGTRSTWPVVTIRGPVLNPQWEFYDHYSGTLMTSLAYDQSVTIDPRPWARTVRRSDGASLAGALTRTTPRLAAMALPPGQTSVAFRGIDPTGTASLSVAWRDAHSHY